MNQSARCFLFALSLAACASTPPSAALSPLPAPVANPAAPIAVAPPAPSATPSPPEVSSTVTITADAVLLDRVKIFDARGLEPDNARQAGAPLLERLLADKGPGFPRRPIAFDIRDGAPTRVALHAIWAAVRVGFSEARFDEVSVPLTRPLGAAGSEALRNRVILTVGRDVVDITWQSDQPCERVPQNVRVRRSDLDKELRFAGIDHAIVIVGDDIPFSNVIPALRDLTSHGTSRLSVSFWYSVGSDASSWPQQCGGPVPAGPHGRLPPEVIQKIVRQNFGALRACYEEGLTRKKGLQGKASTKFVIGRDGHVTKVEDADSDLADDKVLACVRAGFEKMVFPKPEGGIVTVIYPIIFNPGD